jgi:hypothetical protein
MTGAGPDADAVWAAGLALVGDNGAELTRLLSEAGGGRGVTLFSLYFPGPEERNQFNGLSLDMALVFPVAISGGAVARGIPTTTGSG